MRRRVLFFAEPATFAHVVRPLVLASLLDTERYEIHFATASEFFTLASEYGIHCRALRSIGIQAYLRAVARGQPVYSFSTLMRYVEEDRCHINNVCPDLIVGDFRLSLAVSARLERIPYIAISNAYWSPHADPKFEVPVHAITRLIGAKTGNRLFNLLRPLIFAQHSLPMYRLRRKFGMSSLGFDLRRIFTEADMTLFADVPELVPTKNATTANRYRYIGPVIWSPKSSLPTGFFNKTDSRPLIYVTLGSSGNTMLVWEIVSACLSLQCRVAITSGGETSPAFDHPDVFSALFLPGSKVAARSNLVVCNGGSPCTHQALAQGVPVLGIPSNLDQLLNMYYIERSGAGLTLRADCFSQIRAQVLVTKLLQETSFRKEAQRIATCFKRYSARVRFISALTDCLSS